MDQDSDPDATPTPGRQDDGSWVVQTFVHVKVDDLKAIQGTQLFSTDAGPVLLTQDDSEIIGAAVANAVVKSEHFDRIGVEVLSVAAATDLGLNRVFPPGWPD